MLRAMRSRASVLLRSSLAARFTTQTHRRPSATPFHCGRTNLFPALGQSSVLANIAHARACSSQLKSDVVRRLFNDEQNNVVEKAKRLLGTFETVLEHAHADAEDIALLRQTNQKLDQMFMLVIVGEYNSGKSSFLNALLGKKYLKEGVTPTTDRVHVIEYGEEGSGVPLALVRWQQDGDADIGRLQFPVDWLKDINLVDTPGTNAIIRSHQRITEHFIPQCDMVIFVTSADRAFSESEKKFLELITEWKKKVIVALSKVDILEKPEDLKEIIDFISFNMKEVLGHDPTVFPISAKQALKAKEASESSETAKLWERSKFGELERFILETLDEGERGRLKILNPVVVAEKLVEKYRARGDAESKLLKDDSDALERIAKHMDRFQVDIKRDFSFQRDRLENVILRLKQRGLDYLDRTLRLSNLMTLVQPAKLKEEFELYVIGHSSENVEKHVSELVDWLVDKQSGQWHRVMDIVHEQLEWRQANTPVQVSRRGGTPLALNTQFEYNRKQLLQSVGGGVNEIIAEYDKDVEISKLQSEAGYAHIDALVQVSASLMQTAIFEASALGIGAIFTGVLLDFTGIVGVSALAATGFAVLPYRRKKLKEEFSNRIDQLRVTLNESLDGHFEKELHDGKGRISDALSPYHMHVERESERIDKFNGELKQMEEELQSLRRDIHQAWRS